MVSSEQYRKWSAPHVVAIYRAGPGADFTGSVERVWMGLRRERE